MGLGLVAGLGVLLGVPGGRGDVAGVSTGAWLTRGDDNWGGEGLARADAAGAVMGVSVADADVGDLRGLLRKHIGRRRPAVAATLELPWLRAR